MSELDYNTWTKEDLQSLQMEITNILEHKDLDALIEWADEYREVEEGVGLSSTLVEIVNEVYSRAPAICQKCLQADQKKRREEEVSQYRKLYLMPPMEEEE